jgi:hypothetical protein
MAGASYTQVHGLWKQMSGAQQSANLRRANPRAKKALRIGTRVVHKRQLNKAIFGVVISSTTQVTRVRFSGRIQKRLGGALIPTIDLEPAPGGAKW